LYCNYCIIVYVFVNKWINTFNWNVFQVLVHFNSYERTLFVNNRKKNRIKFKFNLESKFWLTRKTNIGHKLNEEQDLKIIVKPMHKWITVLDKWQLECSERPTIPGPKTIVERLQIDWKTAHNSYNNSNEHNSKFSQFNDRWIE
jgi:hypothetical protein